MKWSYKEQRRMLEVAASSKSLEELAERVGRPIESVSQDGTQIGCFLEVQLWSSIGTGAKSEGKMTDVSPLSANMSQRAVMQYLSLTDWKLASRLPVSAGLGMLKRIHELGRIELRGVEPRTEIRLTPLGSEAMRAPV